MHFLVLFVLCFAAVAAVPFKAQRIVGGATTTIDQYPSIASLLYSWDSSSFSHACSGVIINNRSVLTAAHCTFGDPASRWRIRVGTVSAGSGGVLHNTNQNIVHPAYNILTLQNDIAILQSATTFTFGANTPRAASLAGPNHIVGVNDPVWAAGWGAATVGGANSATLRHVQLRIIPHATCRNSYATTDVAVTDNMLCAGWPAGGRGQCQGDSGGPLYHNGVVIGVYSFGIGCGQSAYPGVNSHVGRYVDWIRSHA